MSRTLRDRSRSVVRTITVVAFPSRLDQLSDEALLAALGLGEPDAAAVFIRRFQRKVYGLAYVITTDHGLAEDVAQQAFERAWRHAGSFDHRRGTVGTWLLAITRNLAIDAGRVRRAQPVDPSELLALLPQEATDPDPAAAAVRREALDRLRPALDRLPPEQRRAVVLATVAARTAAEIGELEGIPTPTAKSRLRLGLVKLRAALAREGLT
jgi:RNA polymerase sigma factor (sigma-70 family)